jgi:nitrous oxidase accessory protein NosD
MNSPVWFSANPAAPYAINLAFTHSLTGKTVNIKVYGDHYMFINNNVARRNFSHRNALNYAPQQESEKQLLRTVQIKTPRCLSHSNDEAGNLR